MRYLASDPSKADYNYGSSTVLMTYAWTSGGATNNYRSYLKFDFTSLPADIHVTGATLELTNDGTPHSGNDPNRYDDADTYLRRVTQSWSESSITWNNQPATTEGTSEDDSKVLIPAPATGTQGLTADVTELVKDLLTVAEGNNGFQLKLTDEIKWRGVRYASQEHVDDAIRPKLTINYVESDVVYYLKDHLGNIRVTIDDEGTVLAADDYYPFGLQMPGRSYNDGLVNNIYKYSGKELDEEGGLHWYYFGARYYDPTKARWMAVDPLVSKYPSLTPYNYALNNPLKYIDPDGRDGGFSALALTITEAVGWDSASGGVIATGAAVLWPVAVAGVLTYGLVNLPQRPVSQEQLNTGFISADNTRVEMGAINSEGTKGVTVINPQTQAKAKDQYEKSLKHQPTPNPGGGNGPGKGKAAAKAAAWAGTAAAAANGTVETKKHKADLKKLKEVLEKPKEKKEADNTKIQD